MTAVTFEEAAELERLTTELGRFSLETAAGAGLDSLGYDDDRGWFVGRRTA
ncbi:hypothetical protein [Streptomyces microflavus]|uniref:hypothetical protein n=1 Tax=Streptomyces microflavus TaxID=1919 RepID=UPI0036E8394B